MERFKVGDHVRWDSQSGGYWKRKSGEVVAVIPPRGIPRDHLDYTHGGVVLKDHLRALYAQGKGRNEAETFREKSGGGLGRNEESYLVAVRTVPGRLTRTLYWPVAKLLKRDEKKA